MVWFVLRFYGSVNPMGSCRAWSVYLTTHLLGRLSPHSFARNSQQPFLNQQKGENDRRKYFTINLHQRMLPTSVGVEPATSWSPVRRRIQLSHRGQLIYGLRSQRFEDIPEKYELILPRAPLFHCFSVKFNTPSQPKNIWFVAICIKLSWVLWILSETYFN